jgi:hypothetical protein
MIGKQFAHWSFRYLCDRVAQKMWAMQNPEAPWLTRHMVNILDTWLLPDDVGLEFGSGHSTIWFAERVRHLTSIEHNPEWYIRVQNLLKSCKCNVDYHLHEDGIAKSSMSNYVNVASTIAPASLDFCLIDGKARDNCALVCLDKIKPGGILIIDNINLYIPRSKPSHSPGSRSLRDGYASNVWRQVLKKLEVWRCVWTTDGVTDTAFWIKPLE